MFGIIPSSVLCEQAALLADLLSAAPAPGKGRKPDPDVAAQRAMQSLFNAAAAFCRERRLGVIGRARLAKALQEELRRRNFSPDLVSKVTSAVTVNALASPDSKSKAG